MSTKIVTDEKDKICSPNALYFKVKKCVEEIVDLEIFGKMF